jgi:ribosomal protein S18 acetylase RimI-like enzyme
VPCGDGVPCQGIRQGQGFEILDHPPPGALGEIVAMQAHWYARHWEFGLPFEAKLAAGLGDFAAALPHADSRLWVARRDGQVAGAIAVDGRAAPEARLRWFIVAEEARGGLGRHLLDGALAFCRERGFAAVWLTSFAGLDAARRLYERAGLRLEHEAPDTTWGVRVSEQRFRLVLR